MHADYRTEGSHLTALPLPPQLRGGLMLVCQGDGAPQQPEQLAREILRECLGRSYGGVVLELSPHPCPTLVRLVRLLDDDLARQSRVLYLPRRWAPYAKKAVLLTDEIPSTPAARPYALDCRRSAVDHPLPYPRGAGTALEPGQLAQLKAGRPVYFDAVRCARYFTYRADGCVHFVLYDDAATLREKLRRAERSGVEEAFFAWPEIEDIADRLFSLHGNV